MHVLETIGYRDLWRVRGLNARSAVAASTLAPSFRSMALRTHNRADGRSVMHNRHSRQLRVRQRSTIAAPPDASMWSRPRARCCLLAQTLRQWMLRRRPSLMQLSRRSRAQVMLRVATSSPPRIMPVDDATFL